MSLQRHFTMSKEIGLSKIISKEVFILLFCFVDFFPYYEQGSILLSYFLLLGLWFYFSMFVSLASWEFWVFRFQIFFCWARKYFVLFCFCHDVGSESFWHITATNFCKYMFLIFCSVFPYKVWKGHKTCALCELCLQDMLYIKIPLIVSHHLHWRPSVL